jgi:sugar O-acyltransferase (sialic acid O-acetyltransferase NeuD family)
MAQPLLLIGAGGHGREVLDVVDAINAVTPTFEVVGFLDDGDPDTTLIEGRGHRLLGRSADLTGPLAHLDAGYVIAIGATGPRAEIDAALRATDRACPVLIHPDTTIGPDVILGPGTVVAAGARFGNHIRLGRHVHVNMNSTVHHDAVLEDYVTLSPGVHVTGAAILRAGAFLGTAATVIPGCEVGAAAVIGAGAVVVGDIPPGVTAKGVPARW